MSERGNTPHEDEVLGCVEDGTIERVDASGDGWTVTSDNGWTCGVRNVGVEPKVGDHFRTYGRFGRPFHGQALNGVLLWYRTIAEQETEHKAMVAKMDEERRASFELAREQLDADYESLPPSLRLRIDGFRARNEDFRWQHEGYEMFVSVQAARLAEWAATEPDPVAAVEAFPGMTYAEQVERVPEWSDGHSGNTHGCAIYLARELLTNPERAGLAHAAISPIVGAL